MISSFRIGIWCLLNRSHQGLRMLAETVTLGSNDTLRSNGKGTTMCEQGR